MAKFINKKEQVFDFKFTPYGNYLFSVGKFKPTYYAFYDDNVLYDAQYADRYERQNEIHNRIKNETQYLEGLVLFQDIEKRAMASLSTYVNFLSGEPDEAQKTPEKDIFKFDTAIGDARLTGETQTAPAWKLVALQSFISSSQVKDESNDTNVPQINIDATYKTKVTDSGFNYNPADARSVGGSTATFLDEKSIELFAKDPVIYLEEVNTELLSENFTVEVFEVLTGSLNGSVVTQLTRKYFKRDIPQIENGMMLTERKTQITAEEFTTGSVEYYFDVLVDDQVDKDIACRGADQFNKESYYIDLDFDCTEETDEDLFYDIYGSVTEDPEICQ